jgi:hypothetical protein
MIKNIHLTLIDLERIPKEPILEGDTCLMRKCKELRSKRLVDFSIENLRIMIGQKSGIKYLVPVALEKLEENILVQGDFFPGDLLTNVLRINKDFWEQEPKLYKQLKKLVEANYEIIKNEGIENVDEFIGYKIK